MLDGQGTLLLHLTPLCWGVYCVSSSYACVRMATATACRTLLPAMLLCPVYQCLCRLLPSNRFNSSIPPSWAEGGALPQLETL